MDLKVIAIETYKNVTVTASCNKDGSDVVTFRSAEEFRKHTEALGPTLFVGFDFRRIGAYLMEAMRTGLDPYEVAVAVDGGTPAFRMLCCPSVFAFFDLKEGSEKTLPVGDSSLNRLRAMHGDSFVHIPLDSEFDCNSINIAVSHVLDLLETTRQLFHARAASFMAQRDVCLMFRLGTAGMKFAPYKLAEKVLAPGRAASKKADSVVVPELNLSREFGDLGNRFTDPKSIRKDGSFGFDISYQGITLRYGDGGLHGALDGFRGRGLFLLIDVSSMYPTIIRSYDLCPASVDRTMFGNLLDRRLEAKAAGDSSASSLKLILNSAYGAMRAEYSKLYDPMKARSVCIHGQMLISALIQAVESGTRLVQVNTDGILVEVLNAENLEAVKEAVKGWEAQTGLQVEIEEYEECIQRDVSTYMLRAADGHIKARGALKESSDWDCDGEIIARAARRYLLEGIPVETTVSGETSFRAFQLVRTVSAVEKTFYFDGHELEDTVVRIFAASEGSRLVVGKSDGTTSNVSGTPAVLQLFNGPVTGQPVPEWVDRAWYVEKAKELVRSVETGSVRKKQKLISELAISAPKYRALDLRIVDGHLVIA